MNCKPVLSPKQMAEFTMSCHTIAYRRANLEHIELVNGKKYADDVKLFMTKIHNKNKAK